MENLYFKANSDAEKSSAHHPYVSSRKKELKLTLSSLTKNNINIFIYILTKDILSHLHAAIIFLSCESVTSFMLFIWKKICTKL